MLITFEGLDGSGKTTQTKALYSYLVASGYDVLLAREPGGTEIGDQIRNILHDIHNTAMLPNTEILLYSASRAQLVGEVIRPALQQGRIVLLDRYADSTLAYQGYGRGLGLELLGAVTLFATGGLKPDLTIYLDISVEEGLRRKRFASEAGKVELNRMDRQELAFYERVRDGYLRMAAAEPQRWLVLDGSRSREEIQADIRKRIEVLLGRLGSPIHGSLEPSKQKGRKT